MKRLFFALCFAFLSQGAFSQSCEDGRNFIFLIHGIGGSEKTFGSMDKFLNQNNSCNVARIFVYNTGKSQLSTYHFSDDLNEFVQARMKEGNFEQKDKISLIMHSQGGIVGTLWLSKIKNSDPELFSKVDAFITLSTPYWGSSMATIGEDFFFTLPENLDNPISPVGRTELQEMSHGSATIRAMQSVYTDVFSSQIRALAIGGLKRNYNPYFGEDDTTVSVYSSRPDHYSLKASASSSEAVTKSEFSRSNLIQFIPVSATHFKLDLPGVASLPSSCLYSDQCHHPAISYIQKHLAGEKIDLAESEYSFRKYRVNLYVSNWKNIISKKDQIVAELVKPHGEKETVDFNFRPGSELSSSFSGILESEDEETMIIRFKVNGKVVKVVETPVKGGFSTFINLSLD